MRLIVLNFLRIIEIKKIDGGKKENVFPLRILIFFLKNGAKYNYALPCPKISTTFYTPFKNRKALKMDLKMEVFCELFQKKGSIGRTKTKFYKFRLLVFWGKVFLSNFHYHIWAKKQWKKCQKKFAIV